MFQLERGRTCSTDQHDIHSKMPSARSPATFGMKRDPVAVQIPGSPGKDLIALTESVNSAKQGQVS